MLEPPNESVILAVPKDELEAMIERAVVRGLADIGLKIDEAKDWKEYREDFNFLRRWRKAYSDTASRIGGAVIMALVGGFMLIVALGFKSWLEK